MYRFIVLYVCIYVAPWSCEARHFVPLYVPTCSGMTIKLNLNLTTWTGHCEDAFVCIMTCRDPPIREVPKSQSIIWLVKVKQFFFLNHIFHGCLSPRAPTGLVPIVWVNDSSSECLRQTIIKYHTFFYIYIIKWWFVLERCAITFLSDQSW